MMIRTLASQAKTVYPLVEQERYLLPLIHTLIQRHRKNKTTIIGITGGQGTGKTTLAKFLQKQLQRQGYTVESFSIDDFYASYQERQQLARKYPDNTFYQISRGMPGTHRVKVLLRTLRALKTGKKVSIPVFDKSLQAGKGDIAGTRSVPTDLDFVIVEGWCLGIPVISAREFLSICTKNQISLGEFGATNLHAQVVLKFIKQYQPVWKSIDHWVMLRPATKGLHLKWRQQQEAELRRKTGRGMDDTEVKRFVEPFLPWTYVCYEEMRPQITLWLNEQHRIYRAMKKVK